MNIQAAFGTHLRGRWLWITRAAWLAVTVLALGLYIASLPASYTYYRSVCTMGVCTDDRLTSAQAIALAALGFSPNHYAAYLLIVNAIFAVTFLAVAMVIFVRKSDDWLTIFVALMLVTFGLATFSSQFERLVAVHPAWWLPVQFVELVGDLSILLFLYIFPSGRFTPRWTGALAVVWAVMETAFYFFPSSHLSRHNWPEPFASLAFIAFVGTGLFAQVYRYQRVSDSHQRQQTRWVVFGVTATLGCFLGLVTFLMLAPSIEQNLPGKLLFAVLFPLCILNIPLSIGMAILRSRLWDIDIIIRRTLIYSILTATLAVVYFGSVILFQQFFGAMLAMSTQPAIIGSTLTMAALFTPLRRRIQSTIDRRFYRRKYDAEQVLAAFSAMMRDETDLNKLTTALVTVAQETLQPQQVSLWLKPAAPTPLAYGVSEVLVSQETN